MNPQVQALVAASASFVAITIILCLLLLCSSARRRRTRIDTRPACPSAAAAAVSNSISFDPSIDRFALPELVDATGNFAPDRIVGDGSFGFVYRAVLPSGRAIAVKRLDRDASSHGLREFRAEVETLGRLHHPNLVKILGFCVAGPDRLLIYDYLPHGSLDMWLHEPNSRPGPSLPWPARLAIVAGVATGLAYLHRPSPHKPAVIHRDIKASNVLLGSDFAAHIADFGLARKLRPADNHVSTTVAGTTGYMPPEYRSGSTAATTAADVYSFGVLMLELATGLRPNLPVARGEGSEMGLVSWALQGVGRGEWAEVLDKSMGRDGVVEEEARLYFKVAGLCCHEQPKDRPDMDEVVDLLTGFKVLEVVTSSGGGGVL